MDICQMFPCSLQNKQIFTEFDNSFEHSKIAFSTFVIVTTAINMTHLKIKTASLMIPPLYSWWAVWRKSNPDLEPVLISVGSPSLLAASEHYQAHYIPKQSKCTGCLFLLIRPLMPSCSLRAIAWANTNYIPKAAPSMPLSCKSRS